MNKKFVLGVDIGGSHITSGIIDMMLNQFVPGSEIRKHVDSGAPADEIIKVWGQVIKESMDNYPHLFSKIGIAMPGPFDYEAGICLIKGFAKYEALFGLNIRTLLADELGIAGIDIRFRNDAEAFLEGEIFCGAAKGYNHVIGLTLGTGLGSAISHNGNTVDAELSVTPYKSGIMEDYISTRGILKTYESLAGHKAKHVKEIADLVHHNKDAIALKTFSLFSEHLAHFLQMFILQETPEMVVIGGNIANAWDLFMPHVEKSLAAVSIQVPIVKAILGEKAALIGGACCWKKNYNFQDIIQ